MNTSSKQYLPGYFKRKQGLPAQTCGKPFLLAKNKMPLRLRNSPISAGAFFQGNAPRLFGFCRITASLLLFFQLLHGGTHHQKDRTAAGNCKDCQKAENLSGFSGGFLLRVLCGIRRRSRGLCRRFCCTGQCISRNCQNPKTQKAAKQEPPANASTLPHGH